MVAAMARPCPVLPLVGSMIVPPGFSSPARSAASIIGRPMRSLTDPPGLSISILARSSGCRSMGPRSRVIRLIRTSGVLPTRSSTDSTYCIGGEYRCGASSVDTSRECGDARASGWLGRLPRVDWISRGHDRRGCPRARRTSGRRQGPIARGRRECPRARRTSGRRRDRQAAVGASVLERVVRVVAGGNRHDLVPEPGACTPITIPRTVPAAKTTARIGTASAVRGH